MKLAKRVQLKPTKLLGDLCYRSRNLYNVATWYVRQEYFNLGEWLRYAALAGIEVHRVTEEYTSQTCSRCGQRRKANRVSRGLYKCKQCGLTINADVNAARNIKQKGFRETPRVVEAVDGVVDRGGLDPPVEIKVAT